MKKIKNKEYWRKKYILLQIEVLIVFILMTSLFLYIQLNKIDDDNKYEIRFEGFFTLEEKEWVYNLMNNVDHKYLKNLEEIIFSKDLVESEKSNLLGYNRRMEFDDYLLENKIKIYFVESRYTIANTVCHELLHSTLRLEEKHHYLIYKMADNWVCY